MSWMSVSSATASAVILFNAAVSSAASASAEILFNAAVSAPIAGLTAVRHNTVARIIGITDLVRFMFILLLGAT